MAVESIWLTDAAVLSLVAEDIHAVGVKLSVVNEFPEGLPSLERRVQLDQRIRPEKAAFHFLSHQTIDVLVLDGEKATNIVAVVRSDLVAEIEDIHARRGTSVGTRC